MEREWASVSLCLRVALTVEVAEPTCNNVFMGNLTDMVLPSDVPARASGALSS